MNAIGTFSVCLTVALNSFNLRSLAASAGVRRTKKRLFLRLVQAGVLV